MEFVLMIKCVGRFGDNCTQKCLEGYYGASCKSKCNCSEDTCHKIVGCFMGHKNETNGVCYDEETGAKCCVNYMYLQDEHKCKECEGFFGVNCSEECLAGYYGKQCREKCNCDVSQCDSVLGCLTNKSEKYDLKGNQRTKLGSFLHITIPALLATVVLLVGCFGIIYRCTIIYVRQVPAAADTTTSMEIEEDDTSSTYASVNRLSRRAVKVTGIQQNSRTHGNTLFIEATNQAHAGSLNLRTDHSLSYKSKQNAEDLNDPYSTCLEVEELYDDTACSALSGQYVPQRGLSSEFEDSSSGNSDLPEYIDVLQENERHEH